MNAELACQTENQETEGERERDCFKYFSTWQVIKTTCIINPCLPCCLHPPLSMLHDDKLHIKHPLCLSCGHSGHFSVFKYSKEKEKKKTEIAHVNFNFLFCVLSTKLTRALLCLPGAAAVSGQVDGQRDNGRKRGCYYSGCYINLHQVIPLFTRSLAMGSRERGEKKEKENGDTNTGAFCFLYAKRLLAVRQATTTTTETETTTSSYTCYIS